MIAPRPAPVQPADRFFLLFSGRKPETTAAWVFTLRGPAPDERRLRAAVARALARHPKAASRLVAGGRREYWVPVEEAVERACSFDPPLAGADEESAETERAAHIMCSPLDPTRGPLVRLHSIPQGTYPARLVYRFHHALTDGAGSLAFLRDVLDACNLRPLEGPGAPAGRDPEPLVARSASRKLMLLGRLLALHFRESGKRGLALPVKLYGPGRRPDGGMGHAHIRLEPVRLKRLTSAARRAGASLSVLLLAALARAADAWRAEHGLGEGMLRLVLSQDLRRRRGAPAIAPALENRSGAFPVWVGARDRPSPDALLKSVTAQVRRGLDACAAEATVVFSGMLRLPLALARAVLLPAAVNPRIADSLIFGFLGALPPGEGKGGWLNLDGHPLARPRLLVRPAEGPGAIVLACLLDGALELEFNYLTGLFDAPGAARFLELVDGALDEVAGAARALSAPEADQDDREAPAAAS